MWQWIKNLWNRLFGVGTEEDENPFIPDTPASHRDYLGDIKPAAPDFREADEAPAYRFRPARPRRRDVYTNRPNMIVTDDGLYESAWDRVPAAEDWTPPITPNIQISDVLGPTPERHSFDIGLSVNAAVAAATETSHHVAEALNSASDGLAGTLNSSSDALAGHFDPSPSGGGSGGFDNYSPPNSDSYSSPSFDSGSSSPSFDSGSSW